MTSSFAPQRMVLDNGLTVVHQCNPASPAAIASLSIVAGAVLEPVEQGGLATLTAAALRRGTTSRSKRDIGEILDYRGAHLGCSASRHGTSLVAKMRAVDAADLLELMADCARNPVFPSEELEKLRGNRLTALREDLDDPDTMASRGFREILYPAGHPYASPVRGTVETIESLEVEELHAFHAAHYAPSAALLIVVGAMDWSETSALAQQHFGTWRGSDRGGYRGAQDEIPDVPVSAAVERRLDMPDKAQISLLMGHSGIRRADPRFYSAALMNSVLGRFAMGGRLGRVVREEQGMAYYTYSDFSAGLGAGPFSVRAGVQPQHLVAAIAAIREQIEAVRDNGVQAEELDDARAAAIGSLPRTLESNEGMAALLHQIELFDLGWDYPERYAEIMADVDLDSVNAAAGELLHPEALSLSAAGPLQATATQ
jgi:zinc protease